MTEMAPEAGELEGSIPSTMKCPLSRIGKAASGFYYDQYGYYA